MLKCISKLSITIALCTLMVFATHNAVIGEFNEPPPPTPVENILQSSLGKRGTWFLGSYPPALNNSHPIVFVQGLAVPVHQWWDKLDYHGKNDMYQLAYQNGYKTAFVQLYDKKGPLDQEENGKLLAELLVKIHEHFGEKVNIISHSKGGIDTQVALVKCNAYRYVDKVITIGSPHHGSHLADLFHNVHAHTLIKKLGLEDAGLLSLQTKSMNVFRQEIDQHENIKKNTYYTISGTKWGPKLSLLWCGGLLLSKFGENDGLVNESSTHLPYGVHLSTFTMDHDILRKGSAIFKEIEPILRSWNHNRIQH